MPGAALQQVVPWGDRDVIGLVQRSLSVDIMITGHTHKFDAFERDGVGRARSRDLSRLPDHVL